MCRRSGYCGSKPTPRPATRLLHLERAALKSYAYLQMRLGNLEEGSAAVDKLLELDPTDKVGAKVLWDVLQRKAHGDDED